MCREAFAGRWTRQPDVVTYIITALIAALRFTTLRTLAFSPKPEAALSPFLMHFEQYVRSQKYYTPVREGQKVDMVLIGTGKGNATTWQWKATGIAVASRCFLAAARLSCMTFLYCWDITYPVSCSASDCSILLDFGDKLYYLPVLILLTGTLTVHGCTPVSVSLRFVVIFCIQNHVSVSVL